MKKLLLLVLILIPSINLFAMNPADVLNKIPENFKWECYEYYNKIDKNNVWGNETQKKYMTFKVNINKTDDLVLTQNWFIIPYKYYSDKNNIYWYWNNIWINNDYLLDYNRNTFKEINSKTQNELILSFIEKPEKNNYNFIFNYSSYNYIPEYYISDDNINWDLLKKESIEDFSFKYLKIKFISKTNKNFLEKIKIYELNFPKKSSTILVKSHYNENIEIYSKFNCKNKDFNTKAKNYNDFSINSKTKIIDINAELNPKYNVYSKKDYDNDWVEDELDNCKFKYNPNQADKNWDWKWDICSDDDNDWKIWYYDNCIDLHNPNQTDINRNWVWDKCEFDKDNDWVFDSLDNCINTPNKDQIDQDKDWIWNSCDNCKSYNPRQLDENNNSIWDVCEQEDKNLKENDKDNDWIIDYKDNCKEIANTDQIDSDQDGIWNVCDNCKDIQNNDQLDFNKNWVWDICEDSDWDGVEWLTDNCINIKNPSQNDSDNDWIWDFCEDDDWDNILASNDNCPNDYNPDQSDVDNDNTWDKCDEKDNRYIESNSNFFIWLLVFITIVFWYWIYVMIRKLK